VKAEDKERHVRVVSLGSGSSGNALVVGTGRTAILVDAGFSARVLNSRLRQAEIPPSTIDAVLLTHEHSDHASGAVAFAAQHGIPLVSDPRTLSAVLAQPAATTLGAAAVERVELPVGTSTQLHGLGIRSFPISHDAVAPCGYVLSTGAWTACVVTDTGEAHAPVIEAMRGAHLIVVEANHDKERLIAGPYPWHLKRRILGATGHLSNEQTAVALCGVLDGGPRWVWLAHLSRTNNTPDLARTQVRRALVQHGLGATQLLVSPPGLGPVWDSAALLAGITSGAQAAARVTAQVAATSPITRGTPTPERDTL
jgi:phosphoribosyl 1,2-cyclic phosphodiesterase